MRRDIIKHKEAFKDGKWWERKLEKDSMKKNSDTLKKNTPRATENY